MMEPWGEELAKWRDSWVFIIFAFWGGLCHYIGGVRRGQRKWSLFEVLGDLVVSGFTGSLGFAGAVYLDLNFAATILVVGMSGHMGARSVFLLERYLLDRLLPTRSRGDK